MEEEEERDEEDSVDDLDDVEKFLNEDDESDMGFEEDEVREVPGVVAVDLKGTCIRRESAGEEPFQVRRQRDEDVAPVRGHPSVCVWGGGGVGGWVGGPTPPHPLPLPLPLPPPPPPPP